MCMIIKFYREIFKKILIFQIRGLASSLLITWNWFSSFLLLRYFASLTTYFGMHGTYYLCATVSLLGSLYTCLIIPETKGKSQEQIVDALDGPWLVCVRKCRKTRSNS